MTTSSSAIPTAIVIPTGVEESQFRSLDYARDDKQASAGGRTSRKAHQVVIPTGVEESQFRFLDYARDDKQASAGGRTSRKTHKLSFRPKR
jgi:hypothetical protein